LYVLANQNVFGFDVAVDDFVLMQADESINHLSSVAAALPFSELAMLFEYLIQLTTRRIFKDKINSTLVMKESVHPQNIGMFEMGLNLYFSSNLWDNVGVENLLL
jgi:hypothetical protein